MSLHYVHIYQGVVLMCAPTGGCRRGAEGQGIAPDPTALALPASRAYKVKVGIAGVIHGGSQPEVVPRPRPIQRHPWVSTGQGHDACEASSKRSTPPERAREREGGGDAPCRKDILLQDGWFPLQVDVLWQVLEASPSSLKPGLQV